MTQDTATVTDLTMPDVSQDLSAPATTTAGAMLRGYREAQGLRIDSVASSLKVPASKLESLENDRLDELPDTMFARALTLAVCRVLKADAAPVLALLPGQDVSRLAPKDERGIDLTLQRPSFLPQSQWMTPASFLTSMRGGAVLVLLTALALAFLPELQAWFAGNGAPQPVEAVPAVSPVAPALPVASAVLLESPSVNIVVTPVQSMVLPAVTPIPANSLGASNVR
jgi:cytoskeleton protein RodZ